MMNLDWYTGGHICNGKWKKLPSLLCSNCRGMSQMTFGPPSTLDHCTNCDSKWITNGKCDKCGTIMEWLKTDRPWYKNNTIGK